MACLKKYAPVLKNMPFKAVAIIPLLFLLTLFLLRMTAGASNMEENRNECDVPGCTCDCLQGKTCPCPEKKPSSEKPKHIYEPEKIHGTPSGSNVLKELDGLIPEEKHYPYNMHPTTVFESGNTPKEGYDAIRDFLNSSNEFGPTLSSDYCDELTDDCERLKKLADEAEQRARSARMEAGRAEQEQKYKDADGAWLDEVSEKDRSYRGTKLRQAGEWRELAQSARDSAALNRERDGKYPGTGWDREVRLDEEHARYRDAQADRLDAEARDLEQKIGKQRGEAGDLRSRAEQARAHADEAASIAEAARAAYNACMERRAANCAKQAEAGGQTDSGGSTVTSSPGGTASGGTTVAGTGEDGDDPRDAPPSTIYGEEPVSPVCGPDITDNVFQVLNDLHRQWWNDWDWAKRAEKCRDLINPLTAENAWDIDALSPSEAPISKDTYEETFGSTTNYRRYVDKTKFWFEGAAAACAKPRWPCGPSVTFLGVCIHSQVVNYIQWGFMNRLCDQEGTAAAAHWTRNTASWTDDMIYDGQRMMGDIGGRYAASANARRSGKMMFRSLYPSEQQQELQGHMARRLSQLMNNPEYTAFASRPEATCSLPCNITAEEQEKLRNRKFRARWGEDARR